MPSEFNEFLPKDSEEYKRWKAAQSGDLAGEVAALSVADGNAAAEPAPSDAAVAPADVPAADAPKKSSSTKKSDKSPMVVLERNTRNKKKCITTIIGLDTFGVKLAEASKLFGKKFASGASVVKNPEGKGQIDVQGDFLDQAAELILKQFKEVQRENVYYVDGKKKERYFTED